MKRSLVAIRVGLACGLGIAGCATPSTPVTTPPPTPGTATVYVTSGVPGQIFAFPGSSTGNPSAANTITLSGLNTVTALALDPSGNIYAATATDIREYAAGATGAATPIRTIPFDATTTLAPTFALAADAAGNIYAGETAGSILVFSGSANGSVAPTRVLAGALTELFLPSQLAVDSSGNLYVFNPNLNSQPPILVFAPGASGNVAPIRSLNGVFTAMGVDSAGDIYGLGFGGISIYASGANGSATPTQTIPTSALGFPAFSGGFAIDSSGDIYYASNGTTLNNVRTSVPAIFRLAPPVGGVATVLNNFTPAGWTPMFTSILTPLAVH